MNLRNTIALFTDKIFLKFVIVGIVNTILGTVIMFVFYNVFHLNYWISSMSNYFFGSIVSYLLNKHFTFKFKEKNQRSIIRFIVNIIVCYLLAYGIAKPVIHYMLTGFEKNIQENVSMLLGMCLFVVFNYLGQRFYAFTNRKF